MLQQLKNGFWVLVINIHELTLIMRKTWEQLKDTLQNAWSALISVTVNRELLIAVIAFNGSFVG